MITLRDISKRTGVSVTTISRVLNHDDTIAVSPETNRAIFDAAYELGYKPPKKRKKLESTLVIGVADWRILVGGAQNFSIPSLRYFAEKELPNQVVEFVQLVKEEVMPVDGIIAFGDLSPEEIENLRLSSPHIVFINGSQQGYTYDQILVDLDSSMTQAFDYLVNVKNHRVVGYIGGKYTGDGYTIGARRIKQIVSLMIDKGLYDSELIAVEDFSEKSGYSMASQLLDGPKKPEALIVGSDMIAIGVLKALEERNIKIPDDMGLVIYRDIQTVQLPRGDYAVISAYPDILWQKALQMVLELIRGRTEIVRTVIFPNLLREGEAK